MKTMKISYLAAVIIAVCACSCASEIDSENTAGGLKTFSEFTVDAESCPETKIRLENGGHVKWNTYDSIGVFSDTDEVQLFNKYDDSNVFHGSSPVSGHEFFAYYPYDYITVDPSNRKHLQFNNSRCSTSSPDQNFILPMVARSDGSSLSFKHTAGVLHLSIKGTKFLQDVVIKGNRYESLFGDQGSGYIDLEEEEPVLKIGGTPADKLLFSYDYRENETHELMENGKTSFYYLELSRMKEREWEKLRKNPERWCYLFKNISKFAAEREVPRELHGFEGVLEAARIDNLSPEDMDNYQNMLAAVKNEIRAARTTRPRGTIPAEAFCTCKGLQGSSSLRRCRARRCWAPGSSL